MMRGDVAVARLSVPLAPFKLDSSSSSGLEEGKETESGEGGNIGGSLGSACELCTKQSP